MTHQILRKIELAVAIVVLAAIVVLVFMAAVMRFFGQPLIWSIDMAQLLFIWLCFLGANKALRERGHLGVAILVRNLSRPSRLRLELALSALIIVFLSVLAVQGVKLTLLNMERVFGDSGISYAFVTIAVPFGCLLMTLTVIANCVETLRVCADANRLILSKVDDIQTDTLGEDGL